MQLRLENPVQAVGEALPTHFVACILILLQYVVCLYTITNLKRGVECYQQHGRQQTEMQNASLHNIHYK